MNAETSNPYQAPDLIDDAPSAPLSGDHAGIDYASLKWTASGLSFIYFGIISLLIGWLILLPFGFMFATQGQPVWQHAALLLRLVVVFGPLLMIHFGPVLCLGSPAGTGLRPLAGITVALMALFWIAMLSAVTDVIPAFILIFAGYALMPLTCATFLAFLLRLSKLLKRDDLARRCRNVFFLGLLLCALLLGFTLLRAPLNEWGLLSTLIAVGYFLGFVCVFVAYANLINSLRQAIRRPQESKRFVGLM